MKKFRRIFLLMLIIPTFFVFCSCKSKGSGGNNSQKQNEQQQEPQQEIVSDETYSVYFDYNLPDDYQFLSKNVSIENKKIGTSVNLIDVSSDLQSYFEGWYIGDTKQNNNICSNSAGEIVLKAKWNTENLNKYYYSDGLEFEIESENAFIKSYSGTNSKIIIPQIFKQGENEFVVKGFKNLSLKNSNVDTVILHTTDIDVGESAFAESRLSSIDFSKIKTIGDYAFAQTLFQNVTLSNSLDYVGNGVFSGCENLTYVNFEDSSIDVKDYMFSGCKNLISVNLNSNVQSVGNYSFSGCNKLTSINFISSNVTEIGNYAFLNCIGLTNARVLQNVVSFGEKVFEGCSKLETLNISRLYNTSEDGSDKFVNHIGSVGSSLKTINLEGNAISKLFKYYFDDLTELETLVMCNTITYIEDYTFRHCAKLENIVFSTNINPDNFKKTALENTKYLADLTQPLIFSNVLVYVPSNIDAEYEIPNGVTKISDSAFYENSKLEKIIIPDTVLNIGASAFYNCKNLTEVDFAENNHIVKIENLTFFGCAKLENIDLTKLNNLSEIGNNAFFGVNISNFVLPSTVETLGIDVFHDAKIASFSISGTPDKFEVIDDVLYFNDGNKKELFAYPRLKTGEFFECPTDVTDISAYAFCCNKYLKYVYFSQSTISWQLSINSSGDPVYNSFYETDNKIKFLAENESLLVRPSNIDRCYLLESGFTYDKSQNIITFDVGFSSTRKFYFIKVFDDVAEKYSVVIFEYDPTMSGVKGEITVLENVI